MRKSIRFGWWILLALVILIQFYPCKIPDSVTENPKDLLLSEQIPEEISVLLKGACYDCHSNETTYPFYSYVAPFKWLITRDVNLGRADLNFSEWGDLKKRENRSRRPPVPPRASISIIIYNAYNHVYYMQISI